MWSLLKILFVFPVLIKSCSDYQFNMLQQRIDERLLFKGCSVMIYDVIYQNHVPWLLRGKTDVDAIDKSLLANVRTSGF
jgi:hypothetical protein